MKSPVAIEINEGQVAESAEEPEEGEIIDDFEVVSDDSITFSPQKQGKSIGGISPDSRALSLSSLTDLEVVVEGRPLARSLSLSQQWPDHRVKQKLKRKRQQVVHSGPSLSRLPSDLEDISPSLSDTSLSPDRQPRKKRHSHHHRKRKRILASRQSEDSGSESDDLNFVLTSKKLQKQIKAAISIDCTESHKNSLQSRLQAMSKSNTNTLESVSELKPDEAPVEDALIQEITNEMETKSSEEHNNISGDENELDSELIELRLEALKTALKNKYKDKRQKQKTDINSTHISSETNKENTNIHGSDNTDSDQVEKSVELEASTESVPPSPEEDEDVLRALLLASMSKKITKKAAEVNQTIISTKKPIVFSKSSKIVYNSTINKSNVKTNIVQPFTIKNVQNIPKNNFSLNQNNKKLDKRVQNLPKVKPLIISVSSDSDTEDDLFSTQSLDKCVTDSSNTETTKETTEKISEETVSITKNSTCDNTGNLKPNENVLEKIDTALVNSNAHETTPQSCDVVSNENKFPTEIIPSVIESSVEKFLKEQRAKVDAESRAQISKNLIITRDVNNDELIVGNKPPLINAPHAQGPTSTPKKLTNIVITRNLTSGDKSVGLTSVSAPNKLPNSAVKLLPKNKQIEYQNLLLRLKNAEKKIGIRKPRIRRPSRRISISQTNVNLPSKTSVPNSPKVTKPEMTENKSPEINISGESTKVLEERRSDALLLHNTLKEMQQKVDGRLQIQKKYHSLKPLMKKINEVSKEQKHWNQQVKKLLQELAEAKKHQEEVHHEMTESVKQLVEGKALIDRQIVSSTTAVKVNNNCPLSNNPLYPTLQITSENITSKITKKAPMSVKENINKTITTKINPITTNQNTISPIKNTDASSAKGSTTSDSDLNVGDPNDIDMIISKEHKKKVVKKSLVFNKTKQNMTRKAILQSRSSNKTINPIEKPKVMKISEAISNPTKTQVVDEPDNSLKGPICQAKKLLVADLIKSTTESSKLRLDLVVEEVKEKKSDAEKVDLRRQKSSVETDAVGYTGPVKITENENSSASSCVPASKFKYVSPLDYGQRIPVIDPFSIMCPFEVDGTCKDPECSYKHFLPK